jgi:hypothetical protein
MIQLIFWVIVICVAVAVSFWKRTRKTSERVSSQYLNPAYSPNSHIPRTDFISQIIRSIKANDEQAIIDLLGNLTFEIEAKAIVRSILGVEFAEKIVASETALIELKAIMILMGKQRDWSESTRARFFHDMFFVQSFTIAPAAKQRVLQLLRQFERKEKDLQPFKEPIDDSIFEAAKLAPVTNPVFVWLKTLPPASRMHFMSALKWNWGKKTPVINLEGSTDYALRQFGIDANESCKFLMMSGVFIRPDSFADFGLRISKDDLESMLKKIGVPFPASATKAKLCQLADESEGLQKDLDALIKKHSAVKIDAVRKPQVEELMVFFERMKPLCFAVEFLEFPYKPTSR